jgi:hypothetical protein
VSPRAFPAGRPGIRTGAPANAFRGKSAANPIDLARSGGRGRDGRRAPYISPYRTWNPYGYAPWLGAYDPYLFGSEGDSDDSNAPAASTDAGSGYPAGQDAGPDYGPYPGGDYGPPPPGVYPPLRQSYQAEAPSPPALEQSEAVTLVFRDGRPPEQIHNYLLTRTMLYVQDQIRRSIPVDQLDIAATEKTNQDAGVDFHLPRLPD